MRPSGWCLVGALLCTLVGILAPWAYGVYPDGTEAATTFSGTAYADGRIAMGVWALLAAFSALTLVKRWFFAVVLANVCAAYVALTATLELIDFKSRAAWGLWFLVVASSASFVVVLVVRRETKRDWRIREEARMRARVIPAAQSDAEIVREWLRHDQKS